MSSYLSAVIYYHYCSITNVYVLKCFSCVFFFKQNTAYEMRISDWSSDVCSSDLSGIPCPAYRGHPEDMRDNLVQNMERISERIGALEIGRASCRERVCQHV